MEREMHLEYKTQANQNTVGLELGDRGAGHEAAVGVAEAQQLGRWCQARGLAPYREWTGAPVGFQKRVAIQIRSQKKSMRGKRTWRPRKAAPREEGRSWGTGTCWLPSRDLQDPGQNQDDRVWSRVPLSSGNGGRGWQVPVFPREEFQLWALPQMPAPGQPPWTWSQSLSTRGKAGGEQHPGLHDQRPGRCPHCPVTSRLCSSFRTLVPKS